VESRISWPSVLGTSAIAIAIVFALVCYPGLFSQSDSQSAQQAFSQQPVGDRAPQDFGQGSDRPLTNDFVFSASDRIEGQLQANRDQGDRLLELAETLRLPGSNSESQTIQFPSKSTDVSGWGLTGNRHQPTANPALVGQSINIFAASSTSQSSPAPVPVKQDLLALNPLAGLTLKRLPQGISELESRLAEGSSTGPQSPSVPDQTINVFALARSQQSTLEAANTNANTNASSSSLPSSLLSLAPEENPLVDVDASLEATHIFLPQLQVSGGVAAENHWLDITPINTEPMVVENLEIASMGDGLPGRPISQDSQQDRNEQDSQVDLLVQSQAAGRPTFGLLPGSQTKEKLKVQAAGSPGQALGTVESTGRRWVPRPIHDQQSYIQYPTPLPAALLRQISEAGAAYPQIRDWADSYRSNIFRFCQESSPIVARQILQELEVQRLEYSRLVTPATTNSATQKVNVQLRQLSYSLDRRLDFWQAVIPGNPIILAREEDRLKQGRLATSGPWDLASVQLTQSWSDYLLWPQLMQVVKGQGLSAGDEKNVAGEVLKRINSGTLDYQQTTVIAQLMPLDLQQFLFEKAQLSSPVLDVLAAVERFESTGQSQAAMEIMEGYRWLRLSQKSTDQQMVQLIQNHYRNANFRLTASRDFVNRWFVNQTWVNQLIAQQPQSHVGLGVMPFQIDLIPSEDGFHFQLVPSGNQQSSDGWQPTESSMEAPESAEASNIISIGFQQGEHDQSSPISVGHPRRLVGSGQAIDYVRIPFVDWVLGRKDPLGLPSNPKISIVSNVKVSGSVGRELGDQLQQRLRATQQSIERTIHGFEVAGLNPKVIQNSSSVSEISARYRIADDTQLASHTARPNPTADAILSVQVHQSLVNNSLDRIDVAGKTFSWQSLETHICQVLGRRDINRDWRDQDEFTFAQRQAIGVIFDRDRIWLRMNLDGGTIEAIESGKCQIMIPFIAKIDGVNISITSDPYSSVVVTLAEVDASSANQKNAALIAQALTARWQTAQSLALTPAAWQQDFLAKQLQIAKLDLSEGWLSVSVEKRLEPNIQDFVKTQDRRLFDQNGDLSQRVGLAQAVFPTHRKLPSNLGPYAKANIGVRPSGLRPQDAQY